MQWHLASGNSADHRQEFGADLLLAFFGGSAGLDRQDSAGAFSEVGHGERGKTSRELIAGIIVGSEGAGRGEESG
jgi:hypothetical protein